ncbi:MAG: ribonuclease D [Piscirickettsiaceae bacterium]|nr:ribonuclease D [Piscirickettsiaceae bacterium]
MTFKFINNLESLTAVCQQLIHSKYLTVDTEFIREKTYYPKLCLIQIASDNIIVCVDTIALKNIAPLIDVLYNPNTTIIFHSARQDLEILYLIKGDLPQTLFDTQIAATVLGYGNQISYAKLVEQLIGIKLDKSHSRTDWSKRPLDPEQIHYAADDVRYLRNIYHIMRQQLKDRNRLHWLDDNSATLTCATTYNLNSKNIWYKIKGAGKLHGIQLAILQRLAAWREELAIISNRPRRWMLKDQIMIDLAKIKFASLENFRLINGFKDSTIERHGEKLITESRQAEKLPEKAWPKIKNSKKISKQQNEIINTLMSLLREYCLQQNITPSAIANRKDIENMVRGETDIPLLQGWRNEIIGRYLEQFFKSRSTIIANQK